jgi:hypothetical protein
MTSIDERVQMTRLGHTLGCQLASGWPGDGQRATKSGPAAAAVRQSCMVARLAITVQSGGAGRSPQGPGPTRPGPAWPGSGLARARPGHPSLTRLGGRQTSSEQRGLESAAGLVRRTYQCFGHSPCERSN